MSLPWMMASGSKFASVSVIWEKVYVRVARSLRDAVAVSTVSSASGQIGSNWVLKASYFSKKEPSAVAMRDTVLAKMACLWSTGAEWEARMGRLREAEVAVTKGFVLGASLVPIFVFLSRDGAGATVGSGAVAAGGVGLMMGWIRGCLRVVMEVGGVAGVGVPLVGGVGLGHKRVESKRSILG